VRRQHGYQRYVVVKRKAEKILGIPSENIEEEVEFLRNDRREHAQIGFIEMPMCRASLPGWIINRWS